MSKKNGKKSRASNNLVPSNRDFGEFAEVVEVKFRKTMAMYVKRYGIAKQIPEDLFPALLLWRTVVVRHRIGDMRHRESEMKATIEVAQWVLDLFNELCNHPKSTFSYKEEQ